MIVFAIEGVLLVLSVSHESDFALKNLKARVMCHHALVSF